MGLKTAALLIGLAVLGAGPPPQERGLVSARIEGVLEPEGGGARVTVEFDFVGSGGEDPDGGEVTILAIASPAELAGAEVMVGGGWVPFDLVESAPGRLEGRWVPTEGGDPLTIRYRAPLAQVRAGDGTVIGLRIPVLAPVAAPLRGVGDGAGPSSPVEISIRSRAPLTPRRVFPSGLSLRDDPRGWELAGASPAVPGVIRFGDHHPDAAGTPREFPGGMFWGLWFALGALLAGYVGWVRVSERNGA